MTTRVVAQQSSWRGLALMVHVQNRHYFAVCLLLLETYQTTSFSQERQNAIKQKRLSLLEQTQSRCPLLFSEDFFFRIMSLNTKLSNRFRVSCLQTRHVKNVSAAIESLKSTEVK